MSRAIGLAVVVGAISCGGSDAPAKRPGAESVAPTLALEPRVATIQHVPGGVRSWRVSVPRGATESVSDEAGYGFAIVTYQLGQSSQLLLLANSTEACKPSRYREPPWRVLRAATIGNRCAIASEAPPDGPDDLRSIHVNFEWTDGQITYSCRAELSDDDLLGAWSTMWKICETVVVSRQ